MASADLRHKLDCSICLDLYTDPVTLKCGHNFCRVCIDGVLDTQEGSGGYSCPVCRAGFKKRPTPIRNFLLGNIVESVPTPPPEQEENGIFCTQCIHAPVPAVKSCLHCEASLCDNHLRVHSKSPEHVLCDPTTSLGNRKCSVHKELLKYYCTEDSVCICVSCSVAGEHRGHLVEMLDNAAEKKKKQLRNVLQKLTTKRQETEKRVQRLQERMRKHQEKAAGVTQRVTALIREIRRQLEDLEKRVLGEISRQEERVSLSVSDLIQQLEIKKDELSRRMRHTEELCNSCDPVTVLQEPEDWCDTEDRERHEEQVHGGGDLDVGLISGKLQTLSDIITGIKKGIYIQEATDTSLRPPNISESSHGDLSPQMSPHDMSPHQLSSPPGVQGKGRHTGVTSPVTPSVHTEQGPADILLDVNTAGDYIRISGDRKTASMSLYTQNRPVRPERFQDYPQVMSSGGFSSGRHYWEVEIRRSVRSGRWRVGMCYPSIDRRGRQSHIGDNNKSWCLEGEEYNNQMSVRHDNNVAWLPGDIPCDRVRICLDYEAGQLSFYSLCGPIRHLHTFSSTFTEPLHAALYFVGGCIKISG